MTERVRPPTRLLAQFLFAGWYPGRRRKVSPLVPAGHPAAAVLAAFGGLHVGCVGRGQECEASDIQITELDNGLPIVDTWTNLLGTPLIGIAEVHNAHGELYIDGFGRCFQLAQVDEDTTTFEGGTFDEAATRLILGRKARPMLRPDQEAVCLYGQTFRRRDPGIHCYQGGCSHH